MPYATIQDLPPVTKDLPVPAKRIFLAAFNTAFRKFGTEEKAFKIAWSAVKQVFKKVMGEWEKKKSLDNSFIYSTRFEHYKSQDNDDFFVEGYIEAPGLDIVGDMCTTGCLDDMDSQLSTAVIDAKIGREHEHVLIDRDILHAAKVIIHKRDEDGVFITAKLNKFHPAFENVKGSIIEGLYDAFSIEYIPEIWQEDVILEDGTYVPRLLEKVKLTGITFTGKPIHPGAAITNFGENLIQTMAIKSMDEFKAVWSKAFINTLPDSSFAFISSGGKKDALGMTVPRDLRHLPYKNKKGEIDIPHLRNALARLNQTKITPEEKVKAKKKLLTAAKEAGLKVSEVKKSNHNKVKKMTEKTKTVEPVKEETKSVEPVKTAEPVKTEETKSKTETTTTKEEQIKSLEEEVKSLNSKLEDKTNKVGEEIKSIVLEEIKSLQPDQKNLVKTDEKKFEEQTKSMDVNSQVLKQLGMKGE